MLISIYFSMLFYVCIYSIFVSEHKQSLKMDSFYQELLKKQKELKTTLEAVEKLLEVYTPSNVQSLNVNQNAEVTSVVPKEYDEQMSIKDKVYYVLGLLKKATASEVAEKLMGIDSEFDTKRANRSATHYLSRLYREQEIGARKLGKKYNYYVTK